MKKPKNQHYVAQLYLRKFAIERAKSPRVHVFDKATGKAFTNTVRSVASEDYFYSRDHAQVVEDTFKRLEDMFVTPYLRLLRGDAPSMLSIEERVIVGLFVAIQQLRTREMRESMASMMDGLKLRLGEMDPRLEEQLEYDEETLRRRQLRQLPDIARQTSTIITQMKWVLITNGTSRPYWTSDHPVCLYNPRPAGPAPFMGNLGLASRGIQVFFPLSPVRALCFCDPVDYASMPEVQTTNDEQNVIFQNHLLIQGSTRFLFSNTADFSFARRVLAEQPIFADPQRQRWEVQ